MVRSMMSQTTLLKSFWNYALESAARILNMVPTKKVEKKPYEVWCGQAPKMSYLKVWGCESLVKRDALTKPSKLKPRSIKCIFVGYPKEKMEASKSLKDIEIIQKENKHPSKNTSLHHNEGNQEIDEPQSDIVPIRRSTRTRHAPDQICLYIDDGEYELEDLNEPANYKAALLDPESDKWLDAMNVELQSMKNNDVWDLVDLPPSKWLFKKKTDMDDVVHTYKAHLVVKGSLTYKVDYEEAFSLVTDIRYIRILIAIAISKPSASTPAEVKRMQNIPYASAVGFIMYAVRCTRPDVAFAQNITSRFQHNPGELHWTAVKNILKYLRNTKDVFLDYGVEYIGASDASKETVWVRKFIYGLSVVPTIEEPIKMYCDNTRAITIANESGITTGARHYHAKVHYLHEVIEFSNVKIENVHTDDNLVDPFTKALSFPKHIEHTKNIGMLPASCLM
ncbi:zinc finger, CCHC-type containing protein [Tanacetum coccineum]